MKHDIHDMGDASIPLEIGGKTVRFYPIKAAWLVELEQYCMEQNIAAALRVEYAPFAVQPVALPGFGTRRVLVLPHPSGRCLAWNEAGAFERARKAINELENAK